MAQARSVIIGFAAALLFSGVGVQAQTQVIDEGTFRLLVKGQEVGTETFSIRQNGASDAAVVIAVGKVVLDTARGGHTLHSELQATGRALKLSAYQVQVEGQGAERIAGRIVGGRFSARILSAAGEQMREYLASDGAVVVDEGVAHQYYFLAQRVGSELARVPVVIPRRNQQIVATVAPAGVEAVGVAGTGLRGRHLILSSPGATDRHVWVDEQGRVLRVEIPARDFVAERVAAPK